MAKIRERDRSSIMNAIAGGVTPRQGIQHIQVGRLEETAAILSDIEQVKQGGGAVRVIQASYGSGKSLANLTLVEAENGLKAMGDIQVGDRVLGTDGEYHSVVGVFPQGNLSEWKVGFSNGVDISCSSSHLWPVILPDGSTDTVDTAVLEALVGEYGEVAFPAVVGKTPVKAVSVRQSDVYNHQVKLLRRFCIRISTGAAGDSFISLCRKCKRKCLCYFSVVLNK